MGRFAKGQAAIEAARAEGRQTNFNADKSHYTPWCPDTVARQNRMVVTWQEWIDHYGDENGLSTEHHVRPGFRLPTATQLKTFARFLTYAADGRLSNEPTARYICHSLSMLTGAMHRAGQEVDPEDVKQVHSFIKHQLARERRVMHKQKEKLGFKFADMVNVQLTLWTRLNPETSLRSGCDRIIMTAMLHLFCYTGARIGEGQTIAATKGAVKRESSIATDGVLESEDGPFPPSQAEAADFYSKHRVNGLRYRDLVFRLFPVDQSNPQLVLSAE